MTSDETMIMLIDILKELKTIRFDNEFCEAIGLRKQNLVKIRKGDNHFTPEHIEKAIKKYKVNANWIFGVEHKIFIKNKSNFERVKGRN